MMPDYQNIESALIHGGVFGDPATGAVNVPIYQTSTYRQSEIEGHPAWSFCSAASFL